ncbi:MAG: HD domain-containing phosphohydrolase [Solirubrobacterales bacterium]
MAEPTASHELPTRLTLRLYQAAVATLIAFTVVREVGGASPTAPILGVAAVLGAVALCLWAAVRLGEDRLAWGLIAAGLALAGAGAVIWPDPDTTSFGPGIAVELTHAPLVALGLFAFLRGRIPATSMRLWLDGLIALLAVVALAGALLGSSLAQTASEGAGASLAITLLFLLGHLSIVALVIAGFALAGWRPGRSWTLLGLGLVAMAGADAFGLMGSVFAAVEGTSVERAVSLAGLALIASATSCAPTLGSGMRQIVDRRLLISPAVFAFVGIGLLVVNDSHPIPDLAVALAAATLVAVVARMATAFHAHLSMLEATTLQAETDTLTGMPNRRRLLADLEPVVDPAADPHLLVLLDLDGFKAYNDAYGHAAGDELLRRLGRRLERRVADRGHAYRLGGDEFCVLVRTGSEEAAPTLIDAAEALSETGTGFDVSASYGVCVLPAEADDPSEAMKTADRRMYAEKGSRPGSAAQQARDVLIRAMLERAPGIHSDRKAVARLATLVAAKMRLEPDEVDTISRAAELHDLGKLAIPDRILEKPGQLTDQEWALLHKHPIVGERILSVAPAMVGVARLVRAVNERWDGGGYPDGVSGEDIPLGARIVAACDAFCAMTSERPYRRAMSIEQASAELERQAGIDYDPRIVDVVRETIEGAEDLDSALVGDSATIPPAVVERLRAVLGSAGPAVQRVGSAGHDGDAEGPDAPVRTRETLAPASPTR